MFGKRLHLGGVFYVERGDYLKYSLIAKAYLEELDKKEPFVQHKMITWGKL